jgi:hypothetical protein
MIDFNVSDHWANGTPDWLKSLVSSLDRRHGSSSALPLPTIVAEVADWVLLAGDAWKSRPNRDSLQSDLTQSVDAIGPALRFAIAAPLSSFDEAFAHLVAQSRSFLGTAPGLRTAVAWVDVATSGQALLDALTSDQSVGAAWDDLVAAAQDRTLNHREYRPRAEVLHEQVRLRGQDADGVFRELITVLAFGRDPLDVPLGETGMPYDERLANAKMLVEASATEEPVVVWLGYKGRLHTDLHAGSIAFYDAHWTVPNAAPDRPPFTHKEELWKIVEHGYAFKVATTIDEESEVDTLVRVDLGVTVASGAVERARVLVDTIVHIAIHRDGGIRPRLAESHVLRSGAPAGGGYYAVHPQTGFPDDTYGAGITAEAIDRHGPRIADALSRGELPRFLQAAVEVQAAADYPFSRDMALRPPSDADVSSVIPLSDRVVQHVAAHAAMTPDDLFDQLAERWPQARWMNDVRRAADMALFDSRDRTLQRELRAQLYAARPAQPWLLVIADRANDFRALCRLEHERAWIERMFASVSDHGLYQALVDEYAAEGRILEARRRRVRNALVHGNPANFSVVTSVRVYSDYVSGTALHYALESFVDGTNPASALSARDDEDAAMHGGQDAAAYWRQRMAAGEWPRTQ